MMGRWTRGKRLWALGTVTAAAIGCVGCSVGTDPSTILSASGEVTRGGQPAPATVTLSAGSSYSSSRTVNDGVYQLAIQGGLPESQCSSASVRAELLDPESGDVVDERVENVGACGAHEVDFEFP